MKTVAQAESYQILIVEDDPDHVVLVQAVFARLDEHARINVARSAEEAIAYLDGPTPDADHGRGGPADVIVLDIDMPGMGGLGFLEWYGEQRSITVAPVVVFTSSVAPDLPRRCFELGAKEFKAKSADFSELVPVVQRVLDR